jgi:hypothetical protein
MQILAGTVYQGNYPCPACGKDVNGDNQVGFEELIHIMQKVAGMR